MKRKRPDSIGTKSVNPCLLVIFGARGDLTKRKLVPALYNMAKAGLLPERFAIVGVSREQTSEDQFRKGMAAQLAEQLPTSERDSDLARDLIGRFHYFRSDLSSLEKSIGFSSYLGKIDQEHQTSGNYLFYLATPPDLFSRICLALSKLHLTSEEQGWRRVVIEKPFGHDLESAQSLNRSLTKVLKESQIFRIDHYLGKATVQNIFIFRFANGIFEPIWNRRYIDSIQITVAETLGIEKRAGYYERAGALRDMVSSHLLQLLSLVAMEPPTSFRADDVRNEKVKVLNAIKTLTQENVLHQTVRGQYAEGKIDGLNVPAYRSEPGVSPSSTTETFAALKLELENWRWAGVPFYLRVGKRMPKRYTEIAIQFKCAPFQLFRETNAGKLPPNFLVIKIQPDETIELGFTVKVPGPSIHLKEVQMDFDYREYFEPIPSNGYETLLSDCMNGDGTLFRRADQVERSWQAIAPILEVWSALHPDGFPNYAAGTPGPASADELLVRDGRKWRNSFKSSVSPVTWKKSA